MGLALFGALAIGSVTARADDERQNNNACRDLPSHSALRDALDAAQGVPNGGFGLEMWATLVNRDGIVCAVAFSGGNRGDQWPGSRVISAQKANTANAFSLPALALSTANLYSAVQPGGSLFGLQASNPVDTSVAYGGNASAFGRANDPMVGSTHRWHQCLRGRSRPLRRPVASSWAAVGVSGDSSCADHNIAWRLRNSLQLDYVPGGVSGDPQRLDNIVYDITPQTGQMPGVSAGGWGHPVCSDAATGIAATLPVTH